MHAQDPGSLVFGAWNSHRSGRQARFPRVYAGEVIGWDPLLGRHNAGRTDPLNLVGAARWHDAGKLEPRIRTTRRGLDPRSAATVAGSLARAEVGAAGPAGGFARLNERYERWGLALLELVVRCADLSRTAEGS